jgi:hypothetical protein
MKSFTFFGFLLLSVTLHAESTLPVGCKAITVQGESVELDAKKNKLIFIHNITNTDLWITHSAKNTAVSSDLTSRLQAENWSALAIIKGTFSLNCIESRPGHEQQIPCENSIAVCQWSKVTFPTNHKQTNSWAREDMSLAGLTAAIGANGFVLPTVKII